ncbi:transglutaminase domain-containing protein [Pelomonas sp. SE-A7]|uniref:transglutaminase-like domain-containing protein n=1 Tax=Pelomonas sp. SE-A7 TaxID=3054953 RepID=UPI00259CA8F6|nr:transglutaminase domain-containing protein [Pelomonas sp. SE-A7]MDM4765871.1 transglutaminase domain-containing protein [Pelomonas sp. SE-A7]
MSMQRRTLIAGASAAALLAPWQMSWAQERRFAPQPSPGWRAFELTLTVSVADPQGTSKLWLPLPDLETDFQRTLGHSWTGNAGVARVVADPARDTRMLYAEFSELVKDPTLSVTTRLQTRNRFVDWGQRRSVSEDPEVLRAALAATELLPLDGIVRKTALEITRHAKSDLDKARAIYDWVVSNAHREPKVRGCGVGDIKAMLETGNLGGKCADLNAIFVGLNRAVGVPARDIYGLRVAPSAFGYKELGANSAALKGAQHCRAEVFLKQHGWVAMDPADVLKVARQETTDWIKDRRHPVVAPVDKALFGSWEGNWVGYNRAHDLMLPGSAGKASLPFLMYPQGENRSGRFDELAPDNFKYVISAKEVQA